MKQSSKKGPAPRAAGKTPGRNGYRYKQQFGIVVVCDDEQAQQRAFERLKRAGFNKLRVVTV
ncbi:hypothetical protein ACTJI2_13795 [Pseudoxanthomonas sp. 22568]|uniref:hypothetical protein n=1 Tax=Pseudoxanthomonas sp. 22568 TaxID=3453945 RepID=UPI003F853DE1